MTNRIRLDDDEEFLRSLCFESFAYDESDSLDVESTVSLMENENIDSSDSDAEESDTYRAYIEDKATFLSMQFKTSDEAYSIYNEYAKSVGFGVRKDVYRIHPNGVAIKRRFVCSSEGQRHADKLQSMTPKRTPRQVTRFNCKACIVVVFDSEAKLWTVKEFIGEHTHPLVSYPSSMFLRSHRNVSREALEFATCLNDVGVRKCQVMGHYAHIAGGFLNVGFTKKDLYNKMGKERRSRCIDGDANTLLANLEDKVKLDPLFHYNYELNASGQLAGLFWADSTSRLDYCSFGDVLLFDSTYRSNRYQMPIVVFAGINNHLQTIVFGFALIISECDDTYKWVLKSFIDAMCGEHPKSVITDGDAAIRKALKSILPDSKHRLCSWHVLKNCITNVKIPGFATEFSSIMFMKCSRGEFEERWRQLVEKYKVSHNTWVMKVQKKRARWAESYLHGEFFGGCRSNQRCESINSVIRHHVKPGMRLFELFGKMELAVANIRHREHEEEVRTATTKPFIGSHLIEYAKQAESIYTRAAFLAFRKQLQEESMYTAEDKRDVGDNIRVYTISRHLNRQKKTSVEYNLLEQDARCSCGLFQSFGFSCRHIISVYKHEDLREIPQSCFLRRWTRVAKSVIPNNNPSFSSQAASIIRHSELIGKCKKICLWASQTATNSEAFKSMLSSFSRASEGSPQVPFEMPYIPPESGTMDGIPSSKGTAEVEMPFTPPKTAHRPFVNDPPHVKSKGRPHKRSRLKGQNETRKKKCGYCGIVGHTRPTCPLLHPNDGGPSAKRNYVERAAGVADVSEDDDGLNRDTGLEVGNEAGGSRKTKQCSKCRSTEHTKCRCPDLEAFPVDEVGRKVSEKFNVGKFYSDDGRVFFRITDG